MGDVIRPRVCGDDDGGGGGGVGGGRRGGDEGRDGTGERGVKMRGRELGMTGGRGVTVRGAGELGVIVGCLRGGSLLLRG